MNRPIHVVVAHGAAGGALAGLVVALWFLVADSAAGVPFRTPALLAGVLFEREGAVTGISLVAAYSVLHLGVFTLLGAAAAAALAVMRTPPTLLLGVVFSLFVLDAVFYTALLLTGARIFSVLAWPHVFGANILAGLGLMAYLHRTGRERTPLGWEAVAGHPVLVRGLATGLVGALAVAIWFLALDLAMGQPFRTPGALGSALFLGAEGAAGIRVNLGTVAAYTIVHLAAFGVVGCAFVAAAEQLERTPRLVLLAAMAFIILEALFVATVASGAEWVLGTLGLWSVAVGNLIAVLSMGWHVWRTHPVLRHRLLDEPVQVRI